MQIFKILLTITMVLAIFTAIVHVNNTGIVAADSSFFATASQIVSQTLKSPPSRNSLYSADDFSAKNKIHDEPLTKQRAFDAEEEFESPAVLPPEAWRLIVEAEENSFYKGEFLENNDPAIWVHASRIDIDKKGDADYLVMGRKTPLLGLNVTQFYIILDAGNGEYKIALSTSAKVLFVSDKRHNGGRDIEAVTVAVSKMIGREYRFTNGQYTFKNENVEMR